MAEGRWQRVAAALAPDQGLVLVPGPALRYVAGWSPLPDERPAFLWGTREGWAAVVPAVNADAAAAAWTGVRLLVYTDGEDPAPAVRGAWQAVGQPRRLALDDDCRWAHLRVLEAALSPGPRRESASGILAPLRMVKDATEQAALARAQAINDQAMERALGRLAPGMTEAELAGVIREAYRALGADREAFVLVAGGARSAFPHHEPGSWPLGTGPVLLDIGCMKDGYASDMTRMAYLAPAGVVPETFREVLAAVEAALEAGLECARPGVAAGAVDAAVRGVIQERGFGPRFVHRTGHGIGLEVHEPPSLAAGEPGPLPAGSVFSIEPGIYLPDRFGVRLEEVVVLEPEGPRILSRLSRDLYVVAV